VSNIKEATEEFLRGLTYYGELDSATLAAFRLAAEELDREFRTTLLTEYRRQKEAIQALGIKDEGESATSNLLAPVSGLETR